MDLHTLQIYHQKTEQNSQERLETASDLLRCGLECMADAQAEGFADRALLAEACEYLMEALRLNHRETEAYIGMGYLLWLLGDHTGAMPYLQAALEFDPENSDAKTLMQLVCKTERPVTLPPPVFTTELAQPNFDALYDQVELQILAAIQQVSTLPPQTFEVSNLRVKMTQMERKYRELVTLQGELQAQIQAVEVEIDCSELQKMLRPLDILLARAQDFLNQSWALVQLEETIAEHSQWLTLQISVFDSLNGEISDSFSQAHFDALLEDCDALADLLDEYDGLGIDVASLIDHYEKMTDKVTYIQDCLDQI
ncbi:MAG: hypothetical protein IV090_13200 [Candidatus Sericytochromatia bacterium]|nr:hypothetical protein [Candidatus Sericytochromatia bacterium]